MRPSYVRDHATKIGGVTSFLRALWPWLYDDDYETDYPPDRNWQPIDLFTRKDVGRDYRAGRCPMAGRQTVGVCHSSNAVGGSQG
jgi:hypothetical protein